MTHPTLELAPSQLRRACDPASFSFETTAELPQKSEILGQPRGTRAIEFGIGLDSPGYNIYVLGESGTGRATAIQRFLEEHAARRPVPQDWVYVNNFVEPHKPRALNLPAGLGARLRDDMAALVEHLRREIPKAFERDEYQQARQQIENAFETERDRIFEALQREATAAALAILRTPTGLAIVPLAGGQPMEPQAFEALSPEQKQTLEAKRQELEAKLEAALRAVRDAEKAAKENLRELDRQVAASVVGHRLGELKAKYAEHAETILYLSEVEADVIAKVDDFRPALTPGPSPVGGVSDGRGESSPFRRYTVNLIVDHSRTKGAPVVVEFNPTYTNLVGRLEHEARFGALVTDFTMIKGGALHAANGGYLVLRARDVLAEPFAWDALKRSLIAGCIQSEDLAARGGIAVTRSLDPEPIPLDLKVVLVGPPGLYYWLTYADDDFDTIFKVKADFDSTMRRTPENETAYAEFVAARCREEGLRHFDRAAAARIVEYGSRLAEDQDRLSTRFGDVADVVREADYWAGLAGRDVVTAEDVRRAIAERTYRLNLSEERARQRIEEGTILVDTSGQAVGQVNGLTVVRLGDYAYGLPVRLTARTFVGRSGVVQIDREVNLAGSIHNKGLLTLNGYFGGKYALEAPLTLSAQISFEQTYGGIDGDSASTAELYALLSSLAGRPIKQGIAVTGSVNQKGEVQAIGGLNEKIEGFFALCQSRGLTGEQGVVIPASNARNLALNDEVIQAVAEAKFHIWAVSHVDQGIEILTGLPAGERGQDGAYPEGTIHFEVLKALKETARRADNRGDQKKDEGKRKGEEPVKAKGSKPGAKKKPSSRRKPARKK